MSGCQQAPTVPAPKVHGPDTATATATLTGELALLQPWKYLLSKAVVLAVAVHKDILLSTVAVNVDVDDHLYPEQFNYYG